MIDLVVVELDAGCMGSLPPVAMTVGGLATFGCPFCLDNWRNTRRQTWERSAGDHIFAHALNLDQSSQLIRLTSLRTTAALICFSGSYARVIIAKYYHN